MIIYNKKQFKKIISNTEIKDRILEISHLINKHYLKDDLLILSVLNGSTMVLSELLNNLKCNYKVDYIELSSYDGKTKTSGEINTIKDVSLNVRNKNILIIEDIVDTGNTLNFIYQKLIKMNVGDIKIFSLLLKEEKYKFDIKIDWYGFKIEDIFTIGYGMDYDFKFRGLNDIYALS